MVLLWKWEKKGEVRGIRSWVDTIALLGGWFILEAWAFPERQARPLGWLVFVQYASLVSTVCSAFILLFGARIRRHLHP
jgi:hypothetical protein